ncbi:MAG: hypothetical protein RLZZ175_626 [Bacteroidota bacterium]|jgi:hypothetical protein
MQDITQENNPNIFYSYYLFGLAETKPIWHWENWEKCIKILQPIIDLSPELPLIKLKRIKAYLFCMVIIKIFLLIKDH